MRQFDTTESFILSKSSNPKPDTIATVEGYSAKGDGGDVSWIFTGVTGQTPSQSPSDLSAPYLNDASGNQWALLDFSQKPPSSVGLGEYVIRVSTAGDDSNTGWFVGDELKTPQAAFDLIKSIGSYFIGRWVVQFDAGTYSGLSGSLESVEFEERLRVRGPDVGGHPNVPTVILDGTGATSPYALDFFDVYVRISDIKTINYNSVGSDIAFRIRDRADGYLINCHDDGAAFAGVSSATLSRLRVDGGIYENGSQFGVRAFGNASFTIENCISRNNTQANIIAQDSAQGTIVGITSVGSQAGVNLRNQCSARLSNCDISGASVAGVLVQRQSRWNNDNNTFSVNAANWIHETFSTEVEDYAGAEGEQRRAVDLSSVTHTGDTSLTLIKTIDTLIANSFIEETKKLRIRAYFTSNGAGGTKSIGVRLNGDNMATPADIQAGNGVNGVFEVEIFPTTSNTQGVSSHLARGTGSVVTMGWFNRTVDMTTDKDVRIYVQLVDASDSITINAVESFLVG